MRRILAVIAGSRLTAAATLAISISGSRARAMISVASWRRRRSAFSSRSVPRSGSSAESPMIAVVGEVRPFIARVVGNGNPCPGVSASGTYTKLPIDGDKVNCGDVLYRVDDNPVVLLLVIALGANIYLNNVVLSLARNHEPPARVADARAIPRPWFSGTLAIAGWESNSHARSVVPDRR